MLCATVHCSIEVSKCSLQSPPAEVCAGLEQSKRVKMCRGAACLEDEGGTDGGVEGAHAVDDGVGGVQRG